MPNSWLNAYENAAGDAYPRLVATRVTGCERNIGMAASNRARSRHAAGLIPVSRTNFLVKARSLIATRPAQSAFVTPASGVPR